MYEYYIREYYIKDISVIKGFSEMVTIELSLEVVISEVQEKDILSRSIT